MRVQADVESRRVAFASSMKMYADDESAWRGLFWPPIKGSPRISVRPLAKQSVEVCANEFIGELRRRLESWALVVVSTAAVVVTVGYFLHLKTNYAFTAATIATSADESKIRRLDNGVVVSLGASSVLRVEQWGDQSSVRLLEGAAIFDVPGILAAPFVVSTRLMNASTSVRAKFTVAVDTGVSLRVHEGFINISAAGAEKGALAITLQQGMYFHVPGATKFPRTYVSNWAGKNMWEISSTVLIRPDRAITYVPLHGLTRCTDGGAIAASAAQERSHALIVEPDERSLRCSSESSPQLSCGLRTS